MIKEIQRAESLLMCFGKQNRCDRKSEELSFKHTCGNCLNRLGEIKTSYKRKKRKEKHYDSSRLDGIIELDLLNISSCNYKGATYIYILLSQQSWV